MTRTAAVSSLARELRRRLGTAGVLESPAELAVYECDGYTIEKHRPELVAFPRSAAEVAAVVRRSSHYGLPVVARGAGTSLAGGCLPVGGGVVAVLTRMKRILQIDLRNRAALVEPGVLNVQLGRALAGTGFHFAPDPSSQQASTIGGNVATNAGGPHTLKYGVTGNHVLGLEAVLGDGSVVQIGPLADPPGLDLLSVLVGSEGTLAIVTKVWVRLTPDPQDYRTIRAAFESVEDATCAISDVIGEGIVPAAMELMDQGIIAAVEEAFGFGFPLDAGAIAVIEVDGLSAGLDGQLERIVELCRKWNAREVLQAAGAQERAMLWKCRKMAVGAVGRLSPSYCIQDGVVPRTRLPHVLRRIAQIGAEHGVRIVNVAHAGDGNVHPILLFDERDKEQVARVLAASRELLQECIACGGSVTAEHGIGVEKIEFMERLFAPHDLEAMGRVREAFNPARTLGPGKVLPSADEAAVLTPAPPRAEAPGGRHSPSAVRCPAPPPAEAPGGRHSPSAVRCPAPPRAEAPGRDLKDTAVPLPLTGTVSPADAQEVGAAVREACASGTAVYPVGGATALGYGGLPTRPGLGLSLERISAVIDYPARDLTITVGSGMTIEALAETLAAQRQRLPVDVPCARRATVGGAVATGAAGPRRYAWGTMRDYVLGLAAVDGQGNEFSAGGRVVKNAAGYGLCRLMTGSLGTLAVVTRVTLMVKPLPETSAFLACDVPDFEAAERLLAGLVHTRTLPAAIELLAGPAWREDPALGGLAPGAAARIAVGFEGTGAEVAWQTRQLRDEWRAAGLGEAAKVDEGAAAGLWRRLTDFPAGSGNGEGDASNLPRSGNLDASPFPLVLRASVLPGQTAALAARLVQMDRGASLLAHAGNGVVLARFSAAPAECAAVLRERVRPAVKAFAGHAVVLSAPAGARLGREDVWGPPPAGATAMRAIKERFDPQGILNPGRFIGDQA